MEFFTSVLLLLLCVFSPLFGFCSAVVCLFHSARLLFMFWLLWKCQGQPRATGLLQAVWQCLGVWSLPMRGGVHSANFASSTWGGEILGHEDFQRTVCKVAETRAPCSFPRIPVTQWMNWKGFSRTSFLGWTFTNCVLSLWLLCVRPDHRHIEATARCVLL